jgi:hypothetical protein
MSGVDPIRLAQFLMLPGASELIDAFSSIPPGELRDIAVTHAQVLARHVNGEPQDLPARLRLAPPKLASPFTHGLKAQSMDGQIVERALRGEEPHNIAADLGVKHGYVARLMNKARKEGGVSFPGDDEARPQKKGKPQKRTGNVIHAAPVPQPPYWWQDTDSPIWKNPKLLPGFSERPEGSMAAIGPLDVRTYATMTAAAERRGLTLREYIAQRLLIVRRVADEGADPSVVAASVREEVVVVYALLRKVGRARMAQIVDRATVMAAPNVTPLKTRRRPGGEKQQGPGRWGFASEAALDEARAEVKRLRMKRMAPHDIAAQIGQPQEFVKATFDLLRKYGVKFPPLKRGRRRKIA